MAAGCKEKLALLYFDMAAQASYIYCCCFFYQALGIFCTKKRELFSLEIARIPQLKKIAPKVFKLAVCYLAIAA